MGDWAEAGEYNGKAGTYKVTKRRITITADDKSSEYGDDIVDLTYTATYNLDDGVAILEADQGAFDDALHLSIKEVSHIQYHYCRH